MSRIITRKHYGYQDIRSWKRGKEMFKKSVIEGKFGKVGNVYIFKLYDGYYKIGYTYDIPQRMKDLQASCPTLKCVWSAHVRDMPLVEQELHKHFKKKKTEREIFMLDPQDMIEADRIADKYR